MGGLIAFALGFVVIFAIHSAAMAATMEDSCVDHAIEAERTLDIPSGLLVAVALVESGMDGSPQPFALSVNGRSIFARSSEDAARFLRGGNVYVGCMQLSVLSHRSQFSPVQKMVEPRENVWYAGRMLARLHDELGSWGHAVARYNGGTMRSAQGYVCRVWQNLVSLDPESAKALDVRNCAIRETPSIAPATRRSYQKSQVAELD
jgi:hypothetical protein